jgi:hypothetical protein
MGLLQHGITNLIEGTPGVELSIKPLPKAKFTELRE